MGFIKQAVVFHGIACCVTHFIGNKSISSLFNKNSNSEFHLNSEVHK
jgi:hypothetical protein